MTFWDFAIRHPDHLLGMVIAVCFVALFVGLAWAQAYAHAFTDEEDDDD